MTQNLSLLILAVCLSNTAILTLVLFILSDLRNRIHRLEDRAVISAERLARLEGSAAAQAGEST